MSKEQTFYILSANHIGISGYDIEEWYSYVQKSYPLPKEALEFMELAKKHGLVLNTESFIEHFNILQTIGTNDWIFITN